ncbi:MAG: hypothetical protein ABII90_03545, partial [Bacteroidota bacterium]
GAAGGTKFIPSSQAFWVKANAAGATLSVTEPVKSSQDQSYFKLSSPPNIFRLKISKGVYGDETVIRFVQGATDAYDGNYDAYKLAMGSSPAPYIATVTEIQLIFPSTLCRN